MFLMAAIVSPQDRKCTISVPFGTGPDLNSNQIRKDFLKENRKERMKEKGMEAQKLDLSFKL